MYLLLTIWILLFASDQQEIASKEVIGVYQGTPLFIRNPYLPERQAFCVKAVYVNREKVQLNYELSALKIDFQNQDLYTPVTVRIVSNDTLCEPIIINPDAIFFHTTYKFLEFNLSDTLLTWTTEGEREQGIYTIEKYSNGVWREQTQVSAKSNFDKASYEYPPDLDEGANKYRIKYDNGRGAYLYSREIDYDFYPEPVTFTPKNPQFIITFSRPANYEIFNAKNEVVLEGYGKEVDISRLLSGDYVIYFNGTDPGAFTKN
jgi:hypothetical protein